MIWNTTPYTDGSVFSKEPRPFITSTASANQLLIKQWSSSQSGRNNDRKGPDSVLFTLLSTLPGHPENISLWLLQAVLQWPWPECIWYYSQLNEGFTEATWIKRVTATVYLVLCNAVNRFAEWGFNVFLYTNIMSTSWNIIWTLMLSEVTGVTLWCEWESPSPGGL